MNASRTSMLRSQLLNVVGGRVGIQRRFVHEFQRPGSHVQDSVFSAQLSPALDNAAQSYMRERAPDVGEHLDDFHTRWTRRQVSTAKRRCSFCSFGPK